MAPADPVPSRTGGMGCGDGGAGVWHRRGPGHRLPAAIVSPGVFGDAQGDLQTSWARRDPRQTVRAAWHQSQSTSSSAPPLSNVTPIFSKVDIAIKLRLFRAFAMR